MRRIAIVAAGALLLAGLGWSLTMRQHTLSDAWSTLRRHTLSDAWTAIRRHTLWIAIRRHTSEAWIAVRRHTPFDAPQVKGSASVAPATLPSRAAVREATAARGTHRRAQHQVGAGKAKAAAKRSTDDMSASISSP